MRLLPGNLTPRLTTPPVCTQILVATPLLISLAACLTGCGTYVTTHPEPLDATLVTKLHRDVSTAREVKQLLGTPSGYGAVRLPGGSSPRTAWFYEKFDIDVPPPSGSSDPYFISRQTVLFVFFEGDRYDGYWWFSNAPPPVRINR